MISVTGWSCMVGLSVGHESRIAPIALSGLGATTTLTQKMQRHNNGPPKFGGPLLCLIYLFLSA